jgi:hypothetical protein
MDNDLYFFTLKSALNEIRNACPEITNTFIFKENGEIKIGDETTPEKTMIQVIDAFDDIFDKANAIGNIEHITVDGNNGRVNISCLNDIYFATVISKKADINYVNTITRILIPTVLRLLEKICPASLNNTSILPETESEAKLDSPVETEEKPEPITETKEEKIEKPQEKEPEIKPEQVFNEPQANQLIVENLSDLLTRVRLIKRMHSDTVHIDSVILSQWEKQYEGKKIEEVEIETFDGKSTRCKVKPIKDAKYEGKGAIQIPEKIQQTLQIKKGELVRAKPVIE